MKSEPKNPLNEVFGFPTTNKSDRALHFQANKLCPFNNVVPKCTKVSKLDPLGVCSLIDSDGKPTVICPSRFKQDFLIAQRAAKFFFPNAVNWDILEEVRLKDGYGKRAGNVDLVLVEYNNDGFVTDFGPLEIQSVYISGNLRRPFNKYMQDLLVKKIDWTGAEEYPRPDYLSSSRKRLAPQLIYKGGIFKEWGKRLAVVTDKKFFETLPKLSPVTQSKADIAWFIYDLVRNRKTDSYELTHSKTIYTEFEPALNAITKTKAGPIDDFVKVLQSKFKKKQKGELVADTILASEALE